MYRCNRCGEIIDNINEPCPVCGLYINNNSININNKKKGINLNYILIFGLLIGMTLFIVTSKYNSKIIKYKGNNYSVKYSVDYWNKAKSDNNEYFILKYKNTNDTYLFFPQKTLNISANLKDDAVRNKLYNLYINEFTNSNDYKYTNIKSEFKLLDKTNYYYLSADFKKIDDPNYKGKVYYIYDYKGKGLSLTLIMNDSNLVNIDRDILELLKNIEL